MKIKLSFLAISILLLTIPNLSFAADCSGPPPSGGYNASWARQYKNWCESCCGTYSSSGPSCNPGSNWGCNSSGDSEESTYTPQDSQYDYEAEQQRLEQERLRQEEAERQRQRELDEERKKEEEAARKRQEEFERNKEDALNSMKGIVDNELGLKGTETSDEFGLKGIDDGKQEFGLKGIEDNDSKKDALKDSSSSGHYDPNVVDLRDKKEPLIVDPNTVKGTTENPNSRSDNKMIVPTEEELLEIFNTPGIRQQMWKRYLALLNAPNKSVFPDNPDLKLINPISEPEKYRAYLEAEKVLLTEKLKNKADKNDYQKIEHDKRLKEEMDKAYLRVIDEKMKVEDEARSKAAIEGEQEINALSKKYGLPVTWADDDAKDSLMNWQNALAARKRKEKSDPEFAKAMQEIRDDYYRKIAKAVEDENERALKKLNVEIIKLAK